jgi:hypothetical protein
MEGSPASDNSYILSRFFHSRLRNAGRRIAIYKTFYDLTNAKNASALLQAYARIPRIKRSIDDCQAKRDEETRKAGRTGADSSGSVFMGGSNKNSPTSASLVYSSGDSLLVPTGVRAGSLIATVYSSGESRLVPTYLPFFVLFSKVYSSGNSRLIPTGVRAGSPIAIQ